MFFFALRTKETAKNHFLKVNLGLMKGRPYSYAIALVAGIAVMSMFGRTGRPSI